MRISSAWYSFRQGLKNIRRNILFSLASIGTIIACLFIFGLFYIVLVNFRAAIKKIESNISISVFFDEGITDQNIDLIGEQIRTRPEVNTCDFVSAEEAWINYSNKVFDDPEAARASFGEDNPLANSASYTITLKDVSKQADFVQFLNGIDGVRNVASSGYTSDAISAINVFVGYASIGITVRREEIKIMKLIGATNAFVRSPFIVEGVIIGLVGSVIPVVLLYYLYDSILGYIAGRFTILKSLFEFIPLNELFKVLAPAILIIGVGIGFFGSMLTTRKHLKV